MIKNCLTVPNGIAPCEQRPSTRALLGSIPGKVSCFGYSDISSFKEIPSQTLND